MCSLVLEFWLPIDLVTEWVIKLFLCCQFKRYIFFIFSIGIKTIQPYWFPLFITSAYISYLPGYIFSLLECLKLFAGALFYRNYFLVSVMCCRYLSQFHLAFDFVYSIFFQQKLKYLCSLIINLFLILGFFDHKKGLSYFNIIDISN